MAKPLEIPTQACVGCGAEAQRHPMVGIVKDGAIHAAVPVCDACWRDPAHRTTPIKAHFFAVGDLERALSQAGSMNLGG